MSITKLGEHADLGDALEEFVGVGHNAALGMTVRGHGAGWVELGMPWGPHLVSGAQQAIDTSAIYSLLDAACAMTPWAKLGSFAPYPTLDFRVDYIRPSTPGVELVARGECYAINPDYAFMRGIAHEGDPDQPVARCSGTFMSFKVRP